jgi:hypothetical protein
VPDLLCGAAVAHNNTPHLCITANAVQLCDWLQRLRLDEASIGAMAGTSFGPMSKPDVPRIFLPDQTSNTAAMPSHKAQIAIKKIVIVVPAWPWSTPGGSTENLLTQVLPSD